jgi:alkylation response protein AidB-like acyl-CoA dehydrogenase
MVAHYIDAGCEDYSLEAAISKIFATEAMWRTTYEAQQVAAGSGYMRELPYEQAVRDARILTIFEGTSEILRLYVALAGMKDAGEHLKELRAAVDDIFNNPIKGFGVLGGYAGRKWTQLTAIGRDRIGDRVAAELGGEALVLEHYALRLGRATELLLRRYGRGIVEQQFALKRVADIVIDLFVGLCVLSRASALMSTGGPGSERVLEVAKIFTQQAKRRMQQNLRRLVRNEDRESSALCASVCERGGYGWDVL